MCIKCLIYNLYRNDSPESRQIYSEMGLPRRMLCKLIVCVFGTLTYPSMSKTLQDKWDTRNFHRVIIQ